MDREENVELGDVIELSHTIIVNQPEGEPQVSFKQKVNDNLKRVKSKLGHIWFLIVVNVESLSCLCCKSYQL